MALSDEEEAALRTQLAEQQATNRRMGLEGILKEINAPAAFASVYPVDGALTADALKEWLGPFIPPASSPAAQQTAGATDLSPWADYERRLETSATPGAGGKTEVELLLEEGNKRIREMVGPNLDWNHYRPLETNDRSQKAEVDQYSAKANGVNRTWEGQVRRGAAEPAGYFSGMGFGGRYDAPAWARKADDIRLVEIGQ